MSTHAAQSPENKTPTHSKAVVQEQAVTEFVSPFQDSRPRTLQLKHLQNLAHTNPRTQQALQLQARMQQHTLDTTQRIEIGETEEENPVQGMFETLQRVASGGDEDSGKPIQKTATSKEEKTPIQGKFETVQKQLSPGENRTGMPDTSASSEQATQRKSANKNNTGLPDTLKSGIENLSGYSMDDVQVHYNSPAPAQLQAHAYAQGTDIHLAPGQEKHLPHEAWHVVQQKQGRVKPTTQLKGKVNINDDSGLEKEADVMGAKALQMRSTEYHTLPKKASPSFTSIQLKQVTPTYTGAGHSTAVTVSLKKGDTLPAGSAPSAVVNGFNELNTLGLVQGADNNHRWVKFHVLNQRGGGSGADAANLTPASQTANHTKTWNKFEKNVRDFMEDATTSKGSIQADSVDFNATVGYHAAATIYWKKTADATTLTTNSSNYPNAVNATLKVNWPAAGLNNKIHNGNIAVADGLFKPEDLHSVPGWTAYSDATHTTVINGAVK